MSRSEWLSVMYEYEKRIIEAPARYRGLIFEDGPGNAALVIKQKEDL